MYEGPEAVCCGVFDGSFRLLDVRTRKLRDLVRDELLMEADIIEDASRPKAMAT